MAGNRIEIIESGEARLRLILRLIAEAQTSIKMLFYMFNVDWAGTMVRDALVEAAGRGVDVKLLIDGFGSTAQPKFFTELDEAGGELCVFNPAIGRRYLLRNHQKLVVVDDRVAVIGGANIIQQFIREGLVDEHRLRIIPVLFMEGTRLLQHLGKAL